MLTVILIFLILLFVFCVLTSIAAFQAEYYSDAGFAWGLGAGVVGLVLVGVFIGEMVMIGKLVDLNVIDERIALYETRNEEINAALANMVETYMDYEGKTFEKAKLDNANMVVAIQAYPDLKAQPLVQQQIDIFTENEKEIMHLRENKLSAQATKWWLNFGWF